MRRLITCLALTAAFAAPALTRPAWAENFTRSQIEDIVREFITNNPQVLIDSVERHGRAQQDAEDQVASQKIIENSDWLLKNKKHAEAGNPKGDVTIVEFFDYNCGYCKQALNDVMMLLDADKNVRVVFVEIPILGESSDNAARWALAAMKQKRYLEYHVALMRHKGPLTEGAFVDYAQKVGLDVEKLRRDKLDPAIAVTIDENLRMARTLGIQGTPAFVVGDQLVRGYIGLDGLVQVVNETREKKRKK